MDGQKKYSKVGEGICQKKLNIRLCTVVTLLVFMTLLFIISFSSLLFGIYITSQFPAVCHQLQISYFLSTCLFYWSRWGWWWRGENTAVAGKLKWVTKALFICVRCSRNECVLGCWFPCFAKIFTSLFCLIDVDLTYLTYKIYTVSVYRWCCAPTSNNTCL